MIKDINKLEEINLAENKLITNEIKDDLYNELIRLEKNITINIWFKLRRKIKQNLLKIRWLNYLVIFIWFFLNC